MAAVAAWILLTIAVLAAVVFTVAPIVPGTIFVFAGAIAWGLLRGFEDFAWWFWVVQVVLAVASLAIDNVAQVLGVQRAGGSKEAMLGGTIGVFVGPLVLAPLIGPFALLVGPPIGAVVGSVAGELYLRRARHEVAATARGALLSWFVGTVARLAIVTVQVALLLIVVVA